MVFDGLWDHSFDRVYHYVIPKQGKVVDVHKKGHDLEPAPASIVGSKAASRARKSGQRGRQLSSATTQSVHDINDLPPDQRPPPDADGLYNDEEEEDFITPDGKIDYRQHESQRPGDDGMRMDWGPCPMDERGQPSSRSQSRSGGPPRDQGPRNGQRSRSQSQQSRYVPQDYYDDAQERSPNRKRILNQPYGQLAAGAAGAAAAGAAAKGMNSYLRNSSQNNRDQYGRSASAGRVDRYRPQSYGDNYNDYDDYDDDYDDRRNSRRDRRSSKSKSRRSPSNNGIKGKLDKNFDYRSEKGLTAGALGALAGGLVGHEVGKGPLATVAGVVIGGLGANAFEARNERKDTQKNEQAFGSKRSKSSDGYDRHRDGGGGGRSRGRDYGRDQNYDDEYDSYDEDAEQGARQRSGHKKSSSKKRSGDDGDDGKHWNWNNILKS